MSLFVHEAAMNNGAGQATHAAPGQPELIEARTVSFDEFYRQHCEAIGRALALTLGDHGLGREATDEAFTRAYAKWGEISSYANPEGWVYRVGLNWARSWLRRLTRAAAWRPAAASPLIIDQRVADPDLRRALLALSDEHRSVVVLRYYADWSTEQTAAALQIAPGTVKSRLSRALDQLKNELEPQPSPSSESEELR